MYKFFNILLSLILILTFQSVWSIDVQFNKFTQNLSYESLENAILENPYTGKRDRWGFSAGYSFVEDPLGKGVKNTTLIPILSRLHSIQFGLNMALHKRLELMVNSAFHRATYNLTNEKDTLLGDTRVSLKYQLLMGQDFAIAIIPYGILTTGKFDKYLGKNEISYGTALSIEKNFKRFGSVVNLGYTRSNNNIARNVNHENLYHLGLGVRIPIKEFTAQVEYRVNFTDDSNEQRPNELHLGGSYQVNNSLRAFASIGLGQIDFKNNNDYRLLAGIKGSFGNKEKTVVKEEIESIQRESDLVEEINFEFASYKIDPSVYPILDKIVNTILANKDYIRSIEIVGHTDSNGSEEGNQKLSMKRAESVVKYLVKAGVHPSILNHKGQGETYLKVSPENSKVDSAKNRRVEFKLIQ